ncbi:hypothetical protein LguiB_030069 [Lonicera macranthoides]
MAKMIQFGKASLRSIIHAHRRSPTPTSGTSTTTAKSPFVHPLWVESTKISQPTVLFGFDMLPVRFDSASLLDRQFQNETQCYGKFPDMSRIEARGVVLVQQGREIRVFVRTVDVVSVLFPFCFGNNFKTCRDRNTEFEAGNNEHLAASGSRNNNVVKYYRTCNHEGMWKYSKCAKCMEEFKEGEYLSNSSFVQPHLPSFLHSSLVCPEPNLPSLS